MLCPACGHENSNLATRCAACGSALPTDLEDTLSVTEAADEGTAKRPQIPLDAPAPTIGDSPALGEVAHTAGKYVSSRWAAIGTFFQAHQRALGITLALIVVGVFGAILLAVNLFDAPAYTKIEADIASLLPTYEYQGGTYGPDLSVPLSSVGVTKRSGSRTPEGMETDGVVGPGAFGVEAEATFDDGKIRVVRDVGATYVRSNGEWEIAGDLAERGISFTARAGVDESKVLANMDPILEAASTGLETSLASIYADGSFTVVSNVFSEAANKDTATDDVTIRCTKESGFYSYEGTIHAHFAFESGVWSLRSAEADANAASRTYAPLVGTWSGELVSTKGNGADCYGGQDQQLVVDIESVGDGSGGSGMVKGTITVLAHFHGRLEHDQLSSEGDVVLERMSFTGTMRASRDEDTGSNLVLACQTMGTPDGEVVFTLHFGTDDDPSAVLASVTSTHTYEETLLLFLPHQTTAEFTDSYLLSRSL